MSWSYNPSIAVTTLVWANSSSLAATIEITIVFSSSGYLDVSVLRVYSPCGVTSLQLAGLPHSEICGSKCMCHSPQLIAAYHVLHRLWEPRHSPYALTLLIVLFCSFNEFTIAKDLKKSLTEKIAFLVFLFQYVNERFTPHHLNSAKNSGGSTV